MKPMVWRPDPNDEKVNQYLDRINREPWVGIFAIALAIVCFFTVLVLLGAF
jgi:hypothetical protein